MKNGRNTMYLKMVINIDNIKMKNIHIMFLI